MEVSLMKAERESNMKKLKILVYANFTDDKIGESLSLIEINHKSPRSYMMNWSFEKLLKYIKEECYWQDININSITAIQFYKNDEHWVYSIPKPNFN